MTDERLDYLGKRFQQLGLAEFGLSLGEYVTDPDKFEAILGPAGSQTVKEWLRGAANNVSLKEMLDLCNRAELRAQSAEKLLHARNTYFRNRELRHCIALLRGINEHNAARLLHIRLTMFQTLNDEAIRAPKVENTAATPPEANA